jgi:hypothetical protein
LLLSAKLAGLRADEGDDQHPDYSEFTSIVDGAIRRRLNQIPPLELLIWLEQVLAKAALVTS